MGFFSWKTMDTDESICNRYCGKETFSVVMVNPKTGEMFEENDYEGYGVFGGKNYYDLVAELNGKSGRKEGIDIAFGSADYVAPILITAKNKDEWKKYIGKIAEPCKFQGFFYN